MYISDLGNSLTSEDLALLVRSEVDFWRLPELRKQRLIAHFILFWAEKPNEGTHSPCSVSNNLTNAGSRRKSGTNQAIKIYSPLAAMALR
jgi:hypothetical protein